MGKRIAFITMLFVLLFGTFASAHSGRTDGSGGHNCSDKSKSKGLCTGYHYHNGGGSTSESSPVINNDKDCTDFAFYDEAVQYWNAKGYSATYDPENLDGWGNGVVDDGIPCEPPSGYDRTLINNSVEQAQYKQEVQDKAAGEQAGYPIGKQEGYQELAINNKPNTGSEAFQVGYAIGYNKGYDEGKNIIASEKITAMGAGYDLGKIQDIMVVPEVYNDNPILLKAFEEGFNKAVTERVEAKKKELTDLGYKNGKEDVHNLPKDTEEMYVRAYQAGYDKAQNELKEDYVNQGYIAAFTMLKFQKPNLSNDKFIEWYKKGFESNEEILKIKDAGFSLGNSGEDLIIPSNYETGKVIFEYYYNLGLKEYEEQQSTNKKAAAGGVGVLAFSWLGRRLYIAKRMIS
jgi:hypothetical protein